MFSRSLALLSLLSLLVVVACTDDHDAAATSDCDGHGTFVHGHCHCEAGYQQTEDELGCEPRPDDEPVPPDDDDAFAPETTTAFTALDDNGMRLWVLQAVAGTDVLSIENYVAYGGLAAPDTLALTANEADYATCGTCLVYQTGCKAHGDHFHCDRTFMPRPEGSIALTALGDVGGQLAGTLTGITFQEVTIAEDLTTTPVANGATVTLPAWMFDVTLTAPAE